MKLLLNPSSAADYETFLKIKSLPKYRFVGRTAEFPDEYAHRLGVSVEAQTSSAYAPIAGLFDYQEAIARMAIARRKFAVFVEPGYGKTLIQSEFARHAAGQIDDGRCILMVAPPMVIPQTIGEIGRFYGSSMDVEHVPASRLQSWLDSGSTRIGITNYEAIHEEIRPGRLAGLVLDESSVLKSAYGKWGQTLVRLGRGLKWKLAATGTPAPNDRIEYATHAVLLDQFPTVNSFLAQYFVNRGQTNNRWELKPHALGPFYLSLSHWCIFLSNPATYGWKDNAGTLPPIHVHIHDVPMTREQNELASSQTGTLLGDAGGIKSRGVLSQIAKGTFAGKEVATEKPAYIRRLVDSWPNESTIIWCHYNREQDSMESVFPDAASIRGETDYDARLKMISDFQAGRVRVLISKPKILGFGLNLQVATRQVFSGLQDSYEEYFQAVKRSNRVGSTRPLNVHIPVTRIERPMIQTVIDKSKRVESDTREQEQIFKEMGYGNVA